MTISSCSLPLTVTGFLSDAIGSVRSLQISMFICSITIFVWPFCTTGWSLCLFAIIYSFFASAFPIKVSIIAEACGEISRGCIMTLFAIFEAGCSPGTCKYLNLQQLSTTYTSHELHCSSHDSILGPVVTEGLIESNYLLGGMYFLGGIFLLGNLALLRVPKPGHQREIIMEKYT